MCNIAFFIQEPTTSRPRLIGARRRRLQLALLTVFLFFSAVIAGAQEVLQPVSRFGGFTNDFVADAHRLVAVQANAFTVFDTSGGTFAAGGFLVYEEEPAAVAADAALAFLAVDDRLEVVDIAGAPSPAGNLTLASTIVDLAADGAFAFAVLDSGELAVVDVSDPAAPTLLDTVAALGARGVEATDDVVFVATDMGPVLLEVPAGGPAQILSSPGGVAQTGVRAEGGLAIFFGGDGEGVEIFDVSVPASPVLLATALAGETVGHADRDGTLLFATAAGALEVIDVTDPASPAALGQLAVPFHSGLDAADGELYFTPFGQLQAVDVGDPAAPALDGLPESPAVATDHVIQGGDLLLAADDGFWRYDLADPAMPVAIERVGGFTFASRLRAEGEHVYLVDVDGLHVLEEGVSGTSEVGSLATPFDIAFEVAGDLGFLLSFADLRILDLSDPAAPAEVGLLAFPDTGRDVTVLTPSLVAVATSDFATDGELLIVDVGDPAAPAMVGSLTVPGRPDALASDGTTVRVLATSADGTGFHVHTVDAAAPASPTLTGTLSGSGTPHDIIDLGGDLVATAFGSGGEIDAALEVGAGGHDRAPMAPAGMLRVQDVQAAAEVSAAATPSPAALSGDVSGQTLVSLAGDKIPSSQNTIGSKGVQVFRRLEPAQPQLSLEIINQPRLSCPPSSVRDEEEITDLRIRAENATWRLDALTLRGFGLGDELAHVDQAILRFAGGEESASFSADDGSVTFSLGGHLLAPGPPLELKLSYRLTPEGIECSQDVVHAFGVEAAGSDIDAVALAPAPGEQLPVSSIFSNQIFFACVHNVTRNLGFPQVQPAIDDGQTLEGDEIAVCPGVYDELVTVHKNELKVRSFLGADVTFLGLEQQIGCPPGSGGGTNRVTIPADDVQLLDFTIQGAHHGVLVTGSGAQMILNQIGGNSGDGVRVQAGAAGASLSGNVIGEPQSAVSSPQATERRNGGNGVTLPAGSPGLVEDNKIFGNCANGVEIGGGGALTSPLVKVGGHRIEVNTISGNAGTGVRIKNSADNTIGGTASGNGIFGNGVDGIEIDGEAAHRNIIQANGLGVGSDNFPVIANGRHGIFVHGGADETLVGAEGTGFIACLVQCNAVTLHGGDGIRIGTDDPAAPVSERTRILGNFIGVDFFGSLKKGSGVTENGGNAVGIQAFYADRLEIRENLVSGQRQHGIRIHHGVDGGDPEQQNVVIEQNRVGTEQLGQSVLVDEADQPRGNLGSGIVLAGDLDGRIHDNVLSGNFLGGEPNEKGGVTELPGGGILVDGVTRKIEITENHLGVDKDGSAGLGNDGAGLWIRNSLATTARFNVISANGRGVVYEGPAISDGSAIHELENNTIGLNLARDARLGNGVGVFVAGDTGLDMADNTIAGNNGDGIQVLGLDDGVPRDTTVLIRSNRIGTTDELTDFGNQLAGIRLIGASSNVIGLLALIEPHIPAPNVIHFNQTGVVISAGSQANILASNSIRKNDFNGIEVDLSLGNTFGFVDPGLGNTISENGNAANGVGSGISITNSLSVSVRGNRIENNAHLAIDLDDDGPTPNDEPPTHPLAKADDDVGANGRQNFALTTFTLDGSTVTLGGSLTTLPEDVPEGLPGTYHVDFYEGACQEGAGSGRLGHYLGSIELEVPPSRRATFSNVSFELGAGISIEDVVGLATRIGPDGDLGTSEVPLCPGAAVLFSDGFESGDTGNWN